MKLSVSLPDEDIEYLDAYAERQGLSSRSAALKKAFRLLRASDLWAAYEDSWAEGAADYQSVLWDCATSAGVD